MSSSLRSLSFLYSDVIFVLKELHVIAQIVVLCNTFNWFKVVLSTMGVSKELISNFLIGNRFHVKIRILSPENCKQV